MMAGKCWAMTSFGTSLLRSTRCWASRPGQTTSIRMTSISPDFCERSCWKSASCSLESLGTETTFTWLPVFCDHASAPVLQRSNSAPTEPQATETVACATAGRAVRTELTPTKASAAENRTARRDPTAMGPPREFQRLSAAAESRGDIKSAQMGQRRPPKAYPDAAQCSASFDPASPTAWCDFRRFLLGSAPRAPWRRPALRTVRIPLSPPRRSGGLPGALPFPGPRRRQLEGAPHQRLGPVLVDDHRHHDDQPGHHLPGEVAHAQQEQAVAQDADDRGAEERAHHRALPAAHAGAADDHRGDGIELEADAEDGARDVEAHHVHDRGQPDHAAAQGERGHLVDRWGMAREADRLLVVADGVDHPAEDGAVQ